MQCTRMALVSLESRFGRPQENLGRIFEFIQQAAALQADVVCFPEIAIQGYHSDIRRMRQQAEAIDGAICRRLADAARQHNILVSAGMALQDGGKVYNAQVFVGPAGLLGFAAKVHLCGEEAAMFDAGSTWPVFDLGFAKVGTLICYDAEFPEACRCLALDGAEIVLFSFATGRCDSCGRSQNPLAWPRQVLCWAPARAYENRIFVVGVNHAGDVLDEDRVAGACWIEPGGRHRWPGYSFAISPSGELLTESSRDHNRERILIVDLDPSLLSQWRQGSGDFLRHRRPDIYRQVFL